MYLLSIEKKGTAFYLYFDITNEMFVIDLYYAKYIPLSY